MRENLAKTLEFDRNKAENVLGLLFLVLGDIVQDILKDLCPLKALGSPSTPSIPSPIMRV